MVVAYRRHRCAPREDSGSCSLLFSVNEQTWVRSLSVSRLLATSASHMGNNRIWQDSRTEMSISPSKTLEDVGRHAFGPRNPWKLYTFREKYLNSFFSLTNIRLPRNPWAKRTSSSVSQCFTAVFEHRLSLAHLGDPRCLRSLTRR